MPRRRQRRRCGRSRGSVRTIHPYFPVIFTLLMRECKADEKKKAEEAAKGKK